MIGKTLDSRYHILQLLGQGEMTAVYLANDIKLARKVAIKIPLPHITNEFAQHFLKEAIETIQLVKMSHEHIVNIYDVGTDQDIHFIVMEYIDGVSIKQLLKNKHSLLVRNVLQIILQVCEGLSHMHHKYMIHRDLKPANILLSRSGQVKISDASEIKFAKTGELLGTVLYLSPEQSTGHKVTKQSNIYSLGIVLYELLTGRPPFDANHPGTILLKHIQEPLPDPRQFNANIPASLYHVLQKATHKDPQERYQDVMELYAALDRILKSDDLNHAADLHHLFEQTNTAHEPEHENRDQNPILDIEDTTDHSHSNAKPKKHTTAKTSIDHFYTTLVSIAIIVWALFFLTQSEYVSTFWSVFWYMQYSILQKITLLEGIFLYG